jgi:hypothetical protein
MTWKQQHILSNSELPKQLAVSPSIKQLRRVRTMQLRARTTFHRVYTNNFSPSNYKSSGDECISIQSLIGNNVIIFILCQQIVFLTVISVWRTHFPGKALIYPCRHVQDLRIRMHAILVIYCNLFVYISTGSLYYPYTFAASGYVKFGSPMAYTTTVLAWGVVDYQAGYSSAGTCIVVMVKV